MTLGKDGDGECWCCELFCSKCHAVSALCLCAEPALQSKECDQCGIRSSVCGLSLETIASNGYVLSEAEGVVAGTCKSCGDGFLTTSFNFISGCDICGECHRINDQENMVPCNSSECCGDVEAMFHQRCMVPVGSEVFQCRPCYAVGAVLEDGTDDDSSGSSIQEDGHDLKQVSRHGDIFTGMQYGEGVIQEIWPNIDKVIDRIESKQGGCEIQHLKLSKVCQKVKAFSSKLESMD